jgi:hypothetical protein
MQELLPGSDAARRYRTSFADPHTIGNSRPRQSFHFAFRSAVAISSTVSVWQQQHGGYLECGQTGAFIGASVHYSNSFPRRPDGEHAKPSIQKGPDRFWDGTAMWFRVLTLPGQDDLRLPLRQPR